MKRLMRTALPAILLVWFARPARADDPALEPDPPRKKNIRVGEGELNGLYSQLSSLGEFERQENSSADSRMRRFSMVFAELGDALAGQEAQWGTDGKVADFFEACSKVETPRTRGKLRPAEVARGAWIRLGELRGPLEFLETHRIGNALFVRAAQAKVEYELECLCKVPAADRHAAVKLGSDAYGEMLGECLDAVERYSGLLKRSRRSGAVVDWTGRSVPEADIDRRIVAAWQVRWGEAWGALPADAPGVSVRTPGNPWEKARAGRILTRQTLVRVDGDKPVDVALDGGRRTTVPPGPPVFAAELPLDVGPELAEKIQGWVGDLRSPQYAVRVAAVRELRLAGRAALILLKEHADDPDPEVRLRVRELLEGVGK